MAGGQQRVTLEVLEERIAALDRLVQTSLRSAQEAITKAEQAQEKRFDGVNEFRAAFSDQTQTYVTKTELEGGRLVSQKDRAELRNLYQELRVGQRDLIPRAEAEAAITGMREQMEYLQGAVNRLLITLLTSLVLALFTALIFVFFRQ